MRTRTWGRPGLPRRATALAAVLATLVGLLVIGSSPQAGVGASTPVTVAVTVASQLSFTNSCTDPRGWSLGTVLPGSTATTATGAGVCRFGFSSNNDSSMLRVSQGDGRGTAMSNAAPVRTTQSVPYNQFADVEAVPGTPAIAWAVNQTGAKVFKTTDGGATWTKQANAALNLSGVAAVDANHAFAVGDNGEVMRTVDGTNWTVLPVPSPAPTAGLADVTAVDANTVYAVGWGGIVLRSLNASVASPTWTQITTGVPSYDLLAVTATSAANVVIAGYGGSVRSTNANSGSPSFANFPTPIAGDAYEDVSTLNGTDIYYVSRGGTVRYTHDGGSTWGATTPDPDNILLGVHSFGATSALAVGMNGTVLRTTNGTTFTRIAAPYALTQEPLHAVTGSGTSAIVVGSGATALRTSDLTAWSGAPTFSDGSTVQPAWLDVDGTSMDNDVMVGERGQLRHTPDGGASWPLETTGTTAHLRSVDMLDATNGWTVGDGGTVLHRTTAGGTTWASVPTGLGTNDLYSVSAPDATTVWAVGLGGAAWRSTDGGSNWASVSPGAGALRGVSAIDASTAWAVGDGGSIWRTTNGGASWTSQATTPTTTSRLTGVVAINASVAWVIGGFAEVYRTIDGGATWTKQPYGDGSQVYSIGAVGRYDAFIGGTFRLSHTSDAFTSFDQLNAAGAYFGVSSFDANSGFGVGEGGMIERVDPPAGATRQVADFVGSTTDWTTGTNAFGVCVQSATGAVADWTVESGNGRCDPINADPWYAVPTAAAKVAHTTAAGQAGQVDLVWGVRTSATQAVGAYRATVYVEALAPNV